jgi:hypothetical protein
MTIFMDRTTGRRAGAAVAGLLLAFALFTRSAAFAEQRLIVVELFTSQGCSLCPSAEAYLGELTKRADVLALAYHVDYWDYLGWRDRFAEAAFSRRQQRYAEQFGLPYVYTPQVVIDGHRHASASRPDAAEAEIAGASNTGPPVVNVKLTRLSPGRLYVEVAGAAEPGLSADIVLVGYDERHVTRIESGENSGKTLVNHHVVRGFKSVASWSGRRFELTVPLDDDGERSDFCAVLVQLPGQGRIIGAARIDMRLDPQATAGKN